MQMTNLLVILFFLPFTSTTFDRHFPLASLSVPEIDRRTINLVIWAGPYAAEASIPALLTVMDRVKNKSLLPDYVDVRWDVEKVLVNYHRAECTSRSRVEQHRQWLRQLSTLVSHSSLRVGNILIQHSTNRSMALLGRLILIVCWNLYYKMIPGLFHLAQLLGHYNIPVMPHSCVGSVLATDRDRFPTLSRVAFTSEALGRGVHHLVEHFGWKQVAVLGGDTKHGFIRLAALGVQTYLKSHDIQV